MGHSSWIKKLLAWFAGLVRIRQDLNRLQEKVEGLARSLDQKSPPPQPRDLTPMHGLWWGHVPPHTKTQAYCPACAAEGGYVLLSREDRYANNTPRRDGFVGFRCPKCTSYKVLSLQEEGQALSG